MAEALGKLPSYVSAVELGGKHGKPLSDAYVKAVIAYLKTVPYFRKHRLDEDYLWRLADRTRRSVDVEDLHEHERETMAVFARRLPSLPAQKRAVINKKFEDLLDDQEE
jgi:hypothetical protein